MTHTFVEEELWCFALTFGVVQPKNVFVFCLMLDNTMLLDHADY